MLTMQYGGAALLAADHGVGDAAVARQMQEQQLKARQLVLQQQAASATAAASKTQREVCTPSQPPHLDIAAHALACASGPAGWCSSTQLAALGAKQGCLLVRRCCVTVCRCKLCAPPYAPARMGALLSCDLLAAAVGEGHPCAAQLRLGCSPLLCQGLLSQELSPLCGCLFLCAVLYLQAHLAVPSFACSMVGCLPGWSAWIAQLSQGQVTHSLTSQELSAGISLPRPTRRMQSPCIQPCTESRRTMQLIACPG